MNKQKMIYALLVACFVFTLATPVTAQFLGLEQILTRGKPSMAFDGSFTAVDVQGYSAVLAYPHYKDVYNPNFIPGNRHGMSFYGELNGLPIHFNNHHKFPANCSPVGEPVLHENYNFVESIMEPEEYITAQSTVNEFPIDLDWKYMAWSLPKYDDFILIKIKVTNKSGGELKNFRYGFSLPFRQNHGWDNDQKWKWDDERKMFMFYDDRAFDWESEAATYFEWGPGPTTGDAGDPADITVPNSIRHELRSPVVYTAASFYATPDMNGEDARHYNIVRHTPQHNIPESGTPAHEFPPNEAMSAQEINSILSYEQPRMSFDETAADASTLDGNKYERRPMLIPNFGPYNLADGESVEAVWGFVFGQISKAKIVKGGVDVTTVFVDSGIVDLQKNWDAAKELVDNDFAVQQFPPPTIGEKGNTLTVSADNPGFITVAFDPIPDSYVDPIGGSNDVAGYRVYRSNFSVDGPWELIKDIPKSQVGDYLVNGQIEVDDSDPTLGIGYYYTVDSYDTEGLASAPISYNQFAVYVQRAPGPEDGSGTYVVPNPFRVINKLSDSAEWNRITFVNVPSKCTVRIYTLAGELVRTLEHDDGSGEQAWGSRATGDLLGTQYMKFPAPGIYIYQVESQVTGHEGETFTDKLAIIR